MDDNQESIIATSINNPMGDAGYYFRLAKEAKKDGYFETEKRCLILSYDLDRSNIKVLNALVRNLRKLHDTQNLKYYLNELYKVRPTGKILEELIQIAKRENDLPRERELLLMRRELEPDNKKNNKLLTDKKYHIDSVKRYLDPSHIELVNYARSLIYSEILISEKANGINSLLADSPEELAVSVLAELYTMENRKEVAKKMLKQFKKTLTEDNVEALRFISKITHVVEKRVTLKGNFDTFWYETKKDLVLKRESK